MIIYIVLEMEEDRIDEKPQSINIKSNKNIDSKVN